MDEKNILWNKTNLMYTSYSVQNLIGITLVQQTIFPIESLNTIIISIKNHLHIEVFHGH